MVSMSKGRTIAFYTMTSMFWFAIYSYSAILSPYLKGLGVSYPFIGVICGSYGFAQMMLRLPLGIYSDRIGKRKIFVVLGVFCAAASSLSLAFTDNPYLILIFRTLAGVAASAWVTFTVLFSSYFPPKQSAGKLSYLTMWANFGQVTAMFFGSMLAGIFFYKASFLLGAAVGVISLIIAFTVPESPSVSKPLPIKQLLTVAKNKRLLIMALLAAVTQLIIHGTTNTFTPIIAELLGADTTQIGILATLAAAPRVAAGLLGGMLLSRNANEGKILCISFLVVALASAAIPFVPTLGILYILAAIVGFGTGLPVVVLTSLCIQGIEEGKKSTAMGFFQAAYGVGMFAGPVIVGLFADGLGLKYGYLFCSVVVGLCAIVALYAVKNNNEVQND